MVRVSMSLKVLDKPIAVLRTGQNGTEWSTVGSRRWSCVDNVAANDNFQVGSPPKSPGSRSWHEIIITLWIKCTQGQQPIRTHLPNSCLNCPSSRMTKRELQLLGIYVSECTLPAQTRKVDFISLRKASLAMSHNCHNAYLPQHQQFCLQSRIAHLGKLQ